MPHPFAATDPFDSLPAERLRDILILESTTSLGASSAGMVGWAALTTDRDPASYTGTWPWDDEDLGRCENAFTAAPQWLRDAAEPLLIQFRQRVADRKAEYAAEEAQNRAARAKFNASAEQLRATQQDQPTVTLTVSLTAGEVALLEYVLRAGFNEARDYEFADLGSHDVSTLGVTPEEAFTCQRTLTAALSAARAGQ